MTEPRPPSPRRVVARALALAAVVARAYLEGGEAAGHASALRAQLWSWLEGLDLLEELEPRERAWLQAGPGALTPAEQADASWLCEGQVVLAWALGRHELPAPDEEVDPRRAADAVGFLRDEAGALLALPTLRPAEELALASARLELVLLRLRAFAARPGPVDLEALASGSELGPLVLDGVPLAGGDLRLGGRPLSGARPELVRHALAAAEERVRAARWLLGADPLYSRAGA